jgi:hypothetical protein
MPSHQASHQQAGKRQANDGANVIHFAERQR